LLYAELAFQTCLDGNYEANLDLTQKEDAEGVVRLAELRFVGMARFVLDTVRRNFVFVFVDDDCSCSLCPSSPPFTPLDLTLQANLPNLKTNTPSTLTPGT
jgi:hypothetical protein